MVWVEFYALVSLVLVEQHPLKVSHFAYLRSISVAAHNFYGFALVAYDRMYRRQVLTRGSHDWGVDPGFYIEEFVRQAKVVLQ